MSWLKETQDNVETGDHREKRETLALQEEDALEL